MSARDDAVLIATGVGAVIVLVWFFKKQAVAAAGVAGGVLSGNNALTQNTPYAGAGIFGTLGAGANAISGGALQSMGDWLGEKSYDWMH